MFYVAWVHRRERFIGNRELPFEVYRSCQEGSQRILFFLWELCRSKSQQISLRTIQFSEICNQNTFSKTRPYTKWRKLCPVCDWKGSKNIPVYVPEQWHTLVRTDKRKVPFYTVNYLKMMWWNCNKFWQGRR